MPKQIEDAGAHVNFAEESLANAKRLPPALGELLGNLHLMAADPAAPVADRALMAELEKLGEAFGRVGNLHTFISTPARTGPGPGICKCCGRPY